MYFPGIDYKETFFKKKILFVSYTSLTSPLFFPFLKMKIFKLISMKNELSNMEDLAIPEKWLSRDLILLKADYSEL